MNETAYEMVAQARVKGMWTRVALAGLACLTAILLHPAIWPLIWLAAYIVAQGIDRALFEKSLSATGFRPRERHLITCIIVNVLIFSSLSVYNWCVGGLEGKIFGAISICCSLVSITVTMYPMKRYLYAALIPHALYLMSLPIIGMVMEPASDGVSWSIVVVSIVTFLIYLLVAVKKLNGSMSALKAARDEAQAARRLAEDANAAKSNFFAVITHEIRTPMNAVVSAVTLLKRTPLDDEQKSHLNMLSQASEILLSLLNDVLDLSKIEVGKLDVTPSTVDLSEMLRNLEAMFYPQARQKGLKLKFSADPEVAAHIVSDPLRLRQILFNLLANAVKFTDKGTVRVRVSVISAFADHASTQPVDARLVFNVEDQGIGIAAEQLDRIFSSFAQAEATTTRRYGGTGLGLAISRQLARLMGGDLTVTSVPGEGACFTLSLPYEIAAAPFHMPLGDARSEVVEAVPHKALHHVLIVDDHEINRRIVSLLIEPHGWRWTMATNGAEALEACHEQAFDVILMDMQMPVMDGITATRTLRTMRGPNAHTPVVALTANTMDHHKMLWAEVGVSDFLGKPIDPDLLVRTLFEKAGIEDGPAWDDLPDSGISA